MVLVCSCCWLTVVGVIVLPSIWINGHSAVLHKSDLSCKLVHLGEKLGEDVQTMKQSLPINPFLRLHMVASLAYSCCLSCCHVQYQVLRFSNG